MASVSSQAENSGRDEAAVKLALAISLLRSKHLLPNPPPSDSDDALRWKRKAKERKQELLRLREDLKQAEDDSQSDLFPQSAACKCYFFDQLGKLSPKKVTDGSDRRFNDVLRRRFLRQVRFKERRRRTAGGSLQRLLQSELSNEDELEQLKAAIDFLVELCENVSPVEDVNFANWSHQAVDFILGSNHSNMDSQFYVQHLIRKLGNEPYIGQRAILSVSQTISVLAESLLFTDPFDVAFPHRHESMFIMIQLIEFLISDYLSVWSQDEGFDKMLFEEWVQSIFHARKALELLESRNGLYVLYIDRVTGELSKQVGQVSLLQKIRPEILNKLLC
ncbi:multipolar spindle [Trema orientale]|uniref:Multipolar spindle n=1 Tax=Trema orientale TaxID=63057 RepID=A0A2P5FNN7_TREOI|nr:multipolar spindle [Trema orientale]